MCTAFIRHPCRLLCCDENVSSFANASSVVVLTALCQLWQRQLPKAIHLMLPSARIQIFPKDGQLIFCRHPVLAAN